MTDNNQENTVVSAASIPVTPPKKKNYLNNKDMLVQLALSREQGRMTDELAKMFMMLSERYAKKGCYVGYSYNDDMRSHALLSLVTAWPKFNPEKSSNPFAFFTECIKNSFNQVLNSEKKQRVTRDVLLIKNGLDPSYSFSSEDFDYSSGSGLSDDVKTEDVVPTIDAEPKWTETEATTVQAEDEEETEEVEVRTSNEDFSDEYDIWAEMDKDQE